MATSRVFDQQSVQLPTVHQSRIGRAWARIVRHLETIRAAHNLLGLSERVLADMGLRRADLERQTELLHMYQPEPKEYLEEGQLYSLHSKSKARIDD